MTSLIDNPISGADAGDPTSAPDTKAVARRSPSLWLMLWRDKVAFVAALVDSLREALDSSPSPQGG